MLLAGPVSHTSTQYMDFVEISIFHRICLLFIFLVLVGVVLPLCIVVEYKIVLFYLMLQSYDVSY